MKNYSIMLIFMVMLLVGCGPQTAETLPTLIPSPLPPTEPPTQVASPTPAATNTPFIRATLPPTWTPVIAPTNTLTFTPPPAATAIVVPTLAACTNFLVDFERTGTTFAVGGTVTVAWTAVPGASRYRVVVTDVFGAEVYAGYSVEPTITLGTDFRLEDQRYGWSAYPEDNLAQQMCIPVGGELAPAG